MDDRGMERWRGRVAVVTGAASGVGAGTVDTLLKHGMKVVGLDIDFENMEKPHRPEGADFLPIKCDLRREEDVMAAFSLIRTKYGSLSVSVNVAGVGHRAPILSGEVALWRDMLEVNVIGYALMARESIKLMREKGIEDGLIIFLNSAAGHHVRPGKPDFSMYNCTKYATTALVGSIQEELAALGSQIRATAISPGIIQTDFTHRMYHGDEAQWDKFYQENKVLQVKDITDSIIYILCLPPYVCIKDIHVGVVNPKGN